LLQYVKIYTVGFTCGFSTPLLLQGGGGGGGGDRGGGFRPPAASTGWRLTAENLSTDTSWQDLKDFARTGGKV
jgi:hypothetical protein